MLRDASGSTFYGLDVLTGRADCVRPLLVKNVVIGIAVPVDQR